MPPADSTVVRQSAIVSDTSSTPSRPRVVVLQSNYLPWKGYFDLIHDADLCVFYDDVQYTKNDWRNRNKIKTPQGTAWLTVPTGDHLNRRICDVELPDARWQAKHWKSLVQYYSRAAHFADYRPRLEELFTGVEWRNLSDLNQILIRQICEWLGIKTRFADSRDYTLRGAAGGRLLDLLGQLGAGAYISGPAAQAYLDPAAFASAGTELVWKDYRGYPEYAQFFPPFVHAVTVLDLLFHRGPHAPHDIWGWRQIEGTSRRS